MTDEVANQDRSRCLYEEVFGQGNYAAADDLMAADTVNHGPGSPPVLGTDGIKHQAVLVDPGPVHALAATRPTAGITRAAS